MKNNQISKEKLLLLFVKTSDNNCESHFYFDPSFSTIPKPLLYDFIDELEAEGYLEKKLRTVQLKPKAYSYKRDRRICYFKKFVSVLGRPVSYLITWLLGITSAVLVQYLIHVLHLDS